MHIIKSNLISYNIIKYLPASFILQISIQQNKLELKIETFILYSSSFALTFLKNTYRSDMDFSLSFK